MDFTNVPMLKIWLTLANTDTDIIILIPILMSFCLEIEVTSGLLAN